MKAMKNSLKSHAVWRAEHCDHKQSIRDIPGNHIVVGMRVLTSEGTAVLLAPCKRTPPKTCHDMQIKLRSFQVNISRSPPTFKSCCGGDRMFKPTLRIEIVNAGQSTAVAFRHGRSITDRCTRRDGTAVQSQAIFSEPPLELRLVGVLGNSPVYVVTYDDAGCLNATCIETQCRSRWRPSAMTGTCTAAADQRSIGEVQSRCHGSRPRGVG